MGKRDWAIFFLAIALTVLGVVRVFVEGSIETGAWGLSFRQEGSAPIGPAGVDQLRQYDAAYLGDTRQKRLYLTFDAGYENGSTEKILDTLKAHGVRAAFFLVGNYVDRNRDLVRRWWRRATLWATTPCTTMICPSCRTSRPFPRS